MSYEHTNRIWQTSDLKGGKKLLMLAHWPSLEDVPEGVDVFPDLPVRGKPSE